MRRLPAQSGLVELLAYAPDGSQLAASARPGPTAWSWDLRTDDVLSLKQPNAPAPFALLPQGDLIAPLAYSPSAELLAVGGENQVSFRDNRTGVMPYFMMKGPPHQPRGLAFTPDGQTVVSAGVDGLGGRGSTAVNLWDVATGARQRLPLSLPQGAVPLAFSHDASVLLWREPPLRDRAWHLTLWHVPGRRPLARWGMADSPPCASFSPSGRQIAVAVENLVLLYEIGHVLDYFGAALGPNPWAMLRLPFWWKRFGSRLPPLGSPKVLEGHGDAVRSLAYTPDGTSLLTGSWDYTVRLWDLPSLRQREAWIWPVGVVSSVAVAPDGLTAAVGGSEGRAVIWDLTWF